MPNVASAAPEIGGSVTLRFEGRDYQTTATATWPDYALAREWPTASGIFFTEEDVRASAPVVVLGQTAVRALLPAGRDPVGRYVLVNNVPLPVVGSMHPHGTTSGGQAMEGRPFGP